MQLERSSLHLIAYAAFAATLKVECMWCFKQDEVISNEYVHHKTIIRSMLFSMILIILFFSIVFKNVLPVLSCAAMIANESAFVSHVFLGISWFVWQYVYH